MSMKRPKSKSKPKPKGKLKKNAKLAKWARAPELEPVAPLVLNQGNGHLPESLVEVQVALENSEPFVEISEEIESAAGSVVLPVEVETPAEIQKEIEQPTNLIEEAPPAAQPLPHAGPAGLSVPRADPDLIPSRSEQPVTPFEMEVEIVESAAPVATPIKDEPPARAPEIEVETVKPVSAVEVRRETEIPTIPIAMPVGTQEAAGEAKGADRRTHPRYAFSAGIEVVNAGSGARINTRVRDLSQRGCFANTPNPFELGTVTDLRITKGDKSFVARARVVYNQPGKGMGLMFTGVDPLQAGTLETWIAESREIVWLATNRRRSQRVLMELPVRVSGKTGAASRFEEETHTITINAHGGLLALVARVTRGQHLTLMNVRTKGSLECVVVHVDKFTGGKLQVGVEFMLPDPTFWRVAFPPRDWTPRHPDAKSG
jgi:PilZ domain-containing protein